MLCSIYREIAVCKHGRTTTTTMMNNTTSLLVNSLLLFLSQSANKAFAQHLLNFASFSFVRPAQNSVQPAQWLLDGRIEVFTKRDPMNRLCLFSSGNFSCNMCVSHSPLSICAHIVFFFLSDKLSHYVYHTLDLKCRL